MAVLYFALAIFTLMGTMSFVIYVAPHHHLPE
jgi:hypothetical protein